MSIATLIEVYEEMRRLAIAGSSVAPGDFRLRKLIGPLEKAGEKAPVFAKVAQTASAVLASDDKTSAAALLELITLVNAILYTQGSTGVSGELKPLQVASGGEAIQVSARQLKPVIAALSSTGSGRVEIIRDAIANGMFRDIRLITPAVRAIDDPYPDIADMMVEQVLPKYGRAILPELRARLDIKGRGGHAQRLRLMHTIDPSGTRELLLHALNDGSKEMKVAAISCLTPEGADLVLLAEQAKAKSREVRAAACSALAEARHLPQDAVRILKRGIDSEELPQIIPSVRRCDIPEVCQYVLSQVAESIKLLFECKTKEKQGELVMRAQQLLLCCDPASSVEAESLVLRCFDQAEQIAEIKSEPAGADFNEIVAHMMARGTPTLQRTLVQAGKRISGPMIAPAIICARITLPPATYFGEFRQYLEVRAEGKSKVGADDRSRAQVVADSLRMQSATLPTVYRQWGAAQQVLGSDAQATIPDLDPRWLDVAIGGDHLQLVCTLARPGHTAADRYLSEKLAVTKKLADSRSIIEAMLRVGHSGGTDAVIESLKQQAKESSTYYYSHWYAGMIEKLPRASAVAIEACVATLPEKFSDGLMEALLALKNKPQ